MVNIYSTDKCFATTDASGCAIAGVKKVPVCYHCGIKGHYAPDCQNLGICRSTARTIGAAITHMPPTPICDRCGRSGHVINECYASTDTSGNPIYDVMPDYASCWIAMKKFFTGK